MMLQHTTLKGNSNVPAPRKARSAVVKRSLILFQYCFFKFVLVWVHVLCLSELGTGGCDGDQVRVKAI